MLRILVGLAIVVLAVLAIWPVFGAPWAEEKVVVQEKVVEKAVAVIVTPDPSTAVVFYRPDAVDEAPEGTADCWGSLTSLRALRCANGSQIHDPCFVHGGDTVVCPGEGPDLCAAPACPTAIFTASILGSDAPLPSPSIGTIPWRIELADGTTCRFVSGATTVYEGQRLNYSCSDGEWVYGYPEQGAELWTVWKARFGPAGEGAYVPVEDPVHIAVLTAWY